MQYLTREHIDYCIVRYHIQKARIVDIYNELMAPNLEGELTNQFGIQGMTKLKKDYFYKKIHKIAKESVEEVKQRWMDDLFGEPLAVKRNRVIELAKLYREETDGKIKANILKMLREEVGEQGWQQAVKESGTSNTTILGGMSIEMLKLAANAIITEQLDINESDE